MTESCRLHSNSRGYAALLAVIAVFYLLLEWYTTPTLLDDVVYRFQFTPTGGLLPQPIHSLEDILRSQYWHYLTINGRAPVHLLAQIFLTLVPSHVLDILNALLFALMIHLGVRIITPSRQGLCACATLLAGSMFTLMRGFQGAMLWQLGTFNYLWAITFNLLFFHMLRQNGQTSSRFSHAVALLPVALLAGWSHEALSLPVAIGIGVWLVLHRTTLHQNLHRTLLLTTYMVGTALCLASPGIWHRASDAPTLISRLINGTVAIALNVRFLWILLLSLLILWRKKGIDKHQCLSFLPLTATLAAAYGIVFASGVTLDRVAFHAETIALIALLALWWHTINARSLHILSILMAVASLILFVPATAMCRQQAANCHYAETQMKAVGTSIVKTRDVVPTNGLERIAKARYVMQFADYGYYSVYMAFDASDSNIQCAASLYGKHRLRFLPEDMVKKMEADSLAFSTFANDQGGRLYAKRLRNGQKVSGVEFILRPEAPQSLHFWQRWVAYKGDTFALDDFHWEVVSVAGRKYIVFTRPVTAINRRVQRIVIL